MLTPSTIKRWLLGVILILVLSPLLGTVYTYTRAGESTRVYAATPSTLNFQARLMGSSGALVADGSYSIEFKLYTAVSGGTNEWTETQSVTVKNGYLSAHLGTSTPFSGSIDWSQEKWLTMNVNGDGEMSPRIKLTAVPYAFRAGQADSLSITGGSITGDNLLQKAPGSVQSLSSANAGLRFNQTGAGSLIQLQGDGLDIFTVSKAGDISTAGNLAILGGIGTFGNSTQAGSIILSDGSSHTGTLSTTNLTANRTYTLPDVSGTICLTTTCGPGASFIQNGNTFGTDGVLGTTDAYALRFITQNTEKFTILANGNIGVGDTTPAALFTVGTGDALQINSSGNLVTTGSLTGAGLSVTAGGASINGGLNLNFGDIFNAGAISSISTGYSTFAANGTLNAYGYFRSVDTSDSVSHFEIGAYDISGSFAGGRNLVLNPIGGNVGIGGDTTPDGLFSVGATSQFQVNSLGNVLSVGINNSNGGITNTGALSGVTTLSASGAITAASSGNTINGLIINSGSLSGITGFNQTSGNFSVTGSGAITLGANSNALTIDSTAFDVSSTGALSGITTIALSGSISGATTNTINGLNINSGTLSGVTGLTFTSGGLNLNNGGITNAGAISGVAGLTLISGNLALGGGNITGAASISASTAVTTPSVTNAGILTLSATGAGNDVILNGADQIQLNAGTTIELQDNTNITGALNLTGGITNTASVKFNTAAGNPAYAEGLLFYDNTQKALSYYNSESQVTMNLGQENYVYVYNNTGSTITDGQVVYVNGVNAGVPSIALARSDVVSTAHAAGVATHSIETGTYGFVTAFGEINNFNTASFAAGDTVYLSPTIAGALTNVRPTQPNFTTIVGKVTESNASTGKIHVNLSGYMYGAYTPGAIAFGGSDGNVKQDSTNFFWDDTNNRLGIGTSSPSEKLTITGGNILSRQTGAGAALILDRTDGVVASLKTGSAKTAFFFDEIGSFSIAKDTRANILGGASAGTDIFAVLANGNGSLTGTFTVGTGLTITSGDLITAGVSRLTSAGALQNITGFSQSSGNFAITGTGTFSTGSGAIGLNGAVTAASTLTVTGLTTLNGNLTLQTGDTLTFNGDAFTDLTSNGLVNTAGVLSLDVTTAGAVAGTSSNSGLITAADGLSLLRGCSNAQILKWNGTAWACAADNSGLSDSRLKENVTSLGSVLDDIKNLNVVNFNFKCSDPTYTEMRFTCDQQTGVIAQDLAAVFPGVVTLNDQGFHQVDFGALNFYTLKAVTELAQKIDGSGNATLNTVSTGGVLRLTQSGTLQNINGLNLSSGGASIVGGLNNNGGGITNIGALTGVTNLSAQSISLNATGNQNLLTLTKDGNGVFTVFNSGALELKLDSASALAVKGSNGENALNVDTLTGKVKIGSGNNGKTVLFVLDTKSSDGDPAGVNGAQYYNSKMNKLRCYQNDRWQDCLQTAFSEYGIATQRQIWTQPAGDNEIPGENRTWIDLGNANQIRILTNMAVAANQGATCRLQYSLTDTNPTWHDLSTTGNIQIDKTGALKSDWVQVVDGAKKEVLVRVLCSGGNGIATPDFITIRTQVR